ncbi:AT hook domain-containing protein [Colletotrichum tofieldiae]|nr:AT hook domain-containing protein [Colletotrichum tofieldiae]
MGRQTRPGSFEDHSGPTIAGPTISSSSIIPTVPVHHTLAHPATLQTRLICIGHPGSEDLEAADPGTKTDYGVLHLSIGTFRAAPRARIRRTTRRSGR